MQCVICKLGESHDGKTIVTLQRGQSTIIIKDVPAQICDNCGEYYLSEKVSEHILTLAENALKHNTEVEILHFAA